MVGIDKRAIPIEQHATQTPDLPCCHRSEEHTSELQSQPNLVCRLLLEKKKNVHEQATLRTALALLTARADARSDPTVSHARPDRPATAIIAGPTHRVPRQTTAWHRRIS